MPIIQQQQQISKNYFISIDFLLRTVLFLIAVIIIIIFQHVLALCRIQSQIVFTTNSWSVMGLYVTCWTMIVLYIHTILLTFMDNFQIQFYAMTFVIEDIFTSFFFLIWTIMNISHLSDCSKRQLAANRNETQLQFERFVCESVPSSIYLAPSIGCFIAMFIAISLAGN
jgi:hypothetical protein